MKTKLNFLALMAVVMLIGFTACSKDNSNELDKGTTKNVFLKIKNSAPTTYAEGASIVDGATVGFTSGHLYFVNGQNQIYKYFTLSEDATDLENGKIKLSDITGAGVAFTEIPRAVVSIHVVGNCQAAGLPTTGAITDVQNFVVKVEDQGDISAVNLYGSGGLVLREGGAANEFTSTISLKPTVARIELADITAGSNVTAFKVAGIFVDSYYPEAAVNGAVTAVSVEEISLAIGQYADNSTKYPSRLNPAIYDWYSPEIEATGTPLLAKPTLAVWGYNVFATAAGSTIPRIIIRLENVKGTGDVDLGTRFLTIKGFTVDGTPLTALKAGEVYKIATGDLVFDEDDATVVPNEDFIDVEVSVSLATWKVVNVKPEL